VTSRADYDEKDDEEEDADDEESDDVPGLLLLFSVRLPQLLGCGDLIDRKQIRSVANLCNGSIF
jgi:hypothetical protein